MNGAQPIVQSAPPRGSSEQKHEMRRMPDDVRIVRYYVGVYTNVVVYAGHVRRLPVRCTQRCPGAVRETSPGELTEHVFVVF